MQRFDVTYVTFDSVQEGVGSSQITPLLKRFTKDGMRVNLISLEKDSPSEDLRNTLESADITWTHLPFGRGGASGVLDRIARVQSRIVHTDLVHARSDLAACSSLRANQAPVLWDVRSLWSDQRAYMATSQTSELLAKSTRIFEFYASRKSDAMSTLTQAVVPELLSRNYRIPQKRIVVPTTVDLQLFQFAEKLPTSIRALYSGTYNSYYDLELSKAFSAELRKLVPFEIHWARPHESGVDSLGVGETRTFQSSQAEMPANISKYSFGFSICKLNAGVSLKAAMPTKVAEFLACGRPVVINAGLGDFDGYLKDYGAGIVLTGGAEDLKQKASELVNLLQDPGTPLRCRTLALEHFNMDKASKKYQDLYLLMRKE
jgi:glycosyltransferase involved in cell wall biosynthesis